MAADPARSRLRRDWLIQCTLQFGLGHALLWAATGNEEAVPGDVDLAVLGQLALASAVATAWTLHPIRSLRKVAAALVCLDFAIKLVMLWAHHWRGWSLLEGAAIWTTIEVCWALALSFPFVWAGNRILAKDGSHARAEGRRTNTVLFFAFSLLSAALFPAVLAHHGEAFVLLCALPLVPLFFRRQ